MQAIAGYLHRLNEINGFAEKAIKKVGYPRWDKAIIVDKKANTLIESEDSVVITHIPFVRDSQNYVNASLVVRTTPNDTTLNYVCDWQYAQMPYGVPDTDSSANYAKYFMFFSKRTTGQSAFLITDTFLFSSSPRMHSNDRLKLTILDNNATAGMPETNTNQMCYPVVHCGSPGYCGEVCDYYSPTGCIEPGTCYLSFDCITYPGGDNGGGDGGPVGGDPGGGGSGSGSGGSGSGVPPDCQGPTPAGTGFIETNITCTPGWEPVPDEPEEPVTSYNVFSVDTIGIGNGLQTEFPCISSYISDSLPNINYIAQIAGANIFKDSVYVHLTIDTSTVDTSYSDAAAETTSGAVTIQNGRYKFSSVIKLNGWYLRNSSMEYTISTVVHEVMHAIIRFRWGQYQQWLNNGIGSIDSNWMKTHYPIYWYEYTKQNIPTSQIATHEIIGTDYMQYMSSLVKPFYNHSAPSNIRDTVVTAIAWGWLRKTTAWRLLGGSGLIPVNTKQ